MTLNTENGLLSKQEGNEKYFGWTFGRTKLVNESILAGFHT
jgi:hypothetical protein